MTDASLNFHVHDTVAVLLHPSVVPVIDVFRSIGCLDDQYDLALLDGPEQALSAYVEPSAAKGIVSDALLLAFALTRQRGGAFEHRQVRSRHATIDEYCLMALIGASRQPSSDVAREAAMLLSVSPLDLLSALAGELARHIDFGTITFPMPSLGEFRAIIGVEGERMDAIVEAFVSPGRNFSF
ncbi:hypothetical protein [Microvirga guangxiensis]|uniref:Uncharacterized protein n=1 Tax=Microvirga guangxiensis TaxID=549386 RepID=A0A1G5CCK4_9HYPH|nr:hypothetical protein [Microvirga guangxiensis]SCY00153.1 hypothetical protein SAMN02927923_00528 [Microvirga guangxiensis]